MSCKQRRSTEGEAGQRPREDRGRDQSDAPAGPGAPRAAQSQTRRGEDGPSRGLGTLLGSGRPASSTAGERSPVVCTHPVCGTSSWQPWKTRVRGEGSQWGLRAASVVVRSAACCLERAVGSGLREAAGVEVRPGGRPERLRPGEQGEREKGGRGLCGRQPRTTARAGLSRVAGH